MNSDHLHAFATPAATIEGMAEHLAALIAGNVQATGTCSLALAGGSTPRALYERLAQADYVERIPWPNVQVYWGDERCVAPEDPKSNYSMARSTLLDHVPIEPDQVHPMRGDLDPAESAERYAQELGSDPLDIVLLGLGSDGHTASLFPKGPELHVDTPTTHSQSPIPPTDRITLSLACINRSHQVIFLVTGAAKAQRFQEVRAQLRLPITSNTLPAARVRPSSGPAHWFVDHAVLDS